MTRKSDSPRSVLLALALLLLALMGTGCSDHSHGHGPDQDGHDEHEHGEPVLHLGEAELAEFGIEVRQAQGAELALVQSSPGEIVFDPDRVAHAAARVPGVVQDIRKRTGDRVQRGEVLAVLYSRELAQLKSDYLSAQARADLARATAERRQRLAEQQITSEAEALAARQALREAQLAVQLAERELQALGLSRQQIAQLGAQSNAALARYELTSPLEGIVTARRLTRGESVTPDTAEPLFVIADPQTVWAQLTVYPRQLAHVRPGSAVTIVDDVTGASARGTIDYVTPQVQTATRTAMARVVLDNRDGRWHPGQFVNAHIQVDWAEAEVVVPESALQTLEEGPVVFVRTAEGFEPRPVQLGRRSEGRVEIRSGLRPGEHFAATNTFTLKAELARDELEEAGHVH